MRGGEEVKVPGEEPPNGNGQQHGTSTGAPRYDEATGQDGRGAEEGKP